MHEQRAEALSLAVGKPASLMQNGAVRHLTREPLSDAQIQALVREIASPETAAQLGSARPVAFAYRSPSGEVHVELKSGNAGRGLAAAGRHDTARARRPPPRPRRRRQPRAGGAPGPGSGRPASRAGGAVPPPGVVGSLRPSPSHRRAAHAAASRRAGPAGIPAADHGSARHHADQHHDAEGDRGVPGGGRHRLGV